MQDGTVHVVTVDDILWFRDRIGVYLDDGYHVFPHHQWVEIKAPYVD